MQHAFAPRALSCLASIFVTTMALVAAGCASPNGAGSPTTAPASTSAAGHAECLVCKENADLACVDLTVDKDTPHTQYNGKTYYFCSNECKHDFEKHPEQYAK